MKKSSKFCLLALFLMLGTARVFAKPPVAVFKDWSVFVTVQDNKRLCYIASIPYKKDGNYRKRGEPFMTITREDKKTLDEINVSSGYIYNPEKDVEIEIEKKKYVLISYEERAWTTNTKEDAVIINKMKKGLKMKVLGYSMMNTYSVDTYSLRGFTEAHDKMVELCR